MRELLNRIRSGESTERDVYLVLQLASLCFGFGMIIGMILLVTVIVP